MEGEIVDINTYNTTQYTNKKIKTITIVYIYYIIVCTYIYILMAVPAVLLCTAAALAPPSFSMMSLSFRPNLHSGMPIAEVVVV